MRTEEADDHAAVSSQPRCEIAKAFLEEECQKPGKRYYRGMLVCSPHAELLELEDRAEALVGSVFWMDEWMEENGSSGAEEEFVVRIRRERDEARAALRLTRAQLRSAHQALSVGR
jgi:hypothetical protein